MITTNQDSYFRIVEPRKEYFGTRYFRFIWDTQTVIQVCMSTGKEVKRGKSNSIGVYLIHKQTLFVNYISMGYCEPATKKEYEKAFNQIVETLK